MTSSTGSAARRADLVAAANALPTEPGDWTVPPAVLKAAGLPDDPARVQGWICSCAKWAREAVQQLPQAPEEELEATDFNDYYKVVMSRVQYIFAQADAGVDYEGSDLTYPLCCFQTQLRRQPTFMKGGVEVTLGVLPEGKACDGQAGSFAEVEADFRAKLAVVGRRPFTETTLSGLLASHAPRSKALEEALSPANAAWIKALSGRPMFDLLPAGADFSGGDRVELKVEVQPSGQVVLLAQGPWFRVTFVETPILQFMVRAARDAPPRFPPLSPQARARAAACGARQAAFMTDYMIANGDDGGEAWSREALMMFAATAHRVSEDVLHPKCGLPPPLPPPLSLLHDVSSPPRTFH